ncbi:MULTISPECIES: zinc-binding dehydrogenase [Staphylococcus]|uniref:zinc-binding dehydrogenase n=1 Tax=Staphylococcus TaxID=1279 RepID=UPI003CE87DAA
MKRLLVFLGSFHVAYVGLVNRAFLQPSETLLVLGGAGRTGSSAIQLGKALGATVIATARKQDQATFCIEQGSDFVFNSEKQNFQSAIEDFTNGKGIEEFSNEEKLKLEIKRQQAEIDVLKKYKELERKWRQK